MQVFLSILLILLGIAALFTAFLIPSRPILIGLVQGGLFIGMGIRNLLRAAQTRQRT